MGAMGECRSCGARVVWAETKAGKKMPLDQVDPGTGNIRITDGKVEIGKAGSGHYVSHFATCPESTRWRKS